MGKLRGILVTIFGIVIFALIVCNITNNEKFFEASLTTIMSIIIVVLVSYYFTQQNNKKRKMQEIAEKMISEIQLYSQNRSKSTGTFDKTEEQLFQRLLNNKLYMLSKLCGECNIAREIDYIKAQYGEYQTFIDDNLNNGSFIISSR